MPRTGVPMVILVFETNHWETRFFFAGLVAGILPGEVESIRNRVARLEFYIPAWLELKKFIKFIMILVHGKFLPERGHDLLLVQRFHYLGRLFTIRRFLEVSRIHARPTYLCTSMSFVDWIVLQVEISQLFPEVTFVPSVFFIPACDENSEGKAHIRYRFALLRNIIIFEKSLS